MEKSDHDLSSNRNPLARQLDFSAAAAAVETKMMDSSSQEGSEKNQSRSVIDSKGDQRDEDLASQEPSGTDESGVKSVEQPPRSPVRSPQPSATEDVTPPPQRPPVHRFSHHPSGKCRVKR